MAEVVWLQPDGTSTLHPLQQSRVKTADNKQIYQERYLRGEIFTWYPQYVFLDMTSRAPGHANRGPDLVCPAPTLPTPSLLKNTADWRHSSLCIKKQKCLSTVGRIPRNSEELCQFLVCVLDQRLATSLQSSRAITLGQSMFTHTERRGTWLKSQNLHKPCTSTNTPVLLLGHSCPFSPIRGRKVFYFN